MIPKVIHYCWFGGKEKPAEVTDYIDTWKKYCPDYTIKEWNETNFDISEYAYAQQAYDLGKWAFVSDVARLKALVAEGGIYLDTDVELVRSLDEFLDCGALFGFDRDVTITTAVMGCEQGNKTYQKLLDEYSGRNFRNADGSLNQVTNVMYTSQFVQREGFTLDNEYQEKNGIKIYPKDYFTPINFDSGLTCYSERTAAIHHFSSTWRSDLERMVIEKCREYCTKYGEEVGGRKFRRWKLFYLGFYRLREKGPAWVIGRIAEKLRKH